MSENVSSIKVFNTNIKKVPIEDIKSKLNNNGIVLLKNFTSSVEEFLQLSRLLGDVMPRSRGYIKEDLDETFRYVGHVKFADKLPEEKRLPTQTNDPLPLHTARSFSKVRPKYFAMYMYNEGWIDTEEGLNGESQFAIFPEIIKKYKDLYPNEYQHDLSILMNTKVKRQPWYVKDASDEPIIQINDDSIKVRYWEGMVNSIKEMKDEGKVSKNYLNAIIRFDSLLSNPEHIIEIQLNTNDVIIVNNHKVAHARKGFISQKNGRVNPRELFTTWIK